MTIKEILLSAFLLSLVGCTEPSIIEPTITLEPSTTPTFTETIAPTITSTKTIVPTKTITAIPTTVPIPTWAVRGPGEITAPVLLYHHVDPDSNSTLYNVPPSQFEAQMKALADWGYTTITISELVTAINKGAPLPPRPIVITFDDGNYSVYQYAFPIMEKNGFIGVNYLVVDWVGASGYIGLSELAELYAAGWEVGSHSYSHVDLQVDHSLAFYEIRHSKIDLAALIGQPVNTFAFPFGTFDEYLGDRVGRWGYSAGIGLGKRYVHDHSTLFYVPRIEIKQAYDLEEFGSLLPWSSPPE